MYSTGSTGSVLARMREGGREREEREWFAALLSLTHLNR